MINPGVYIVVDTVNFLEISFLHIVGEYTKWLLRKHISIWGIYRYIRVRWSRIVFDLFLRRTPGSPVPRAYGYRRTWDIYAICVRRTPAGLPILYIITPPTGIDKVRIEIPIPLDVVRGLYVVRSVYLLIHNEHLTIPR